MTTPQFLLIEDRAPLRIVTLNRPEVLNAWNRPMREELVAALGAFDADPDLRALVITGAGARAFCAGQDLGETVGFDENAAETWIDEFQALYGAIRQLSKPVVAALNGVAAGSAFQAALLMDVRIGHPGVRMGQPEINSGIASVTGPWIMREVLGLSRTVELTLTGRLMSADEALHVGALHRVVAEEALMQTALETAKDLAGKAPEAMRIDKQWIREMTEPGFQAAFDAARRLHRQSYAAGEPQKMSAAFLDRRRKG